MPLCTSQNGRPAGASPVGHPLRSHVAVHRACAAGSMSQFMFQVATANPCAIALAPVASAIEATSARSARDRSRIIRRSYGKRAMDRTARITLVATGLGLFMIFLDALIVNVGLPAIQADFGVGEAGLQWVVAAYSLGMAVFIMTSATLADMHGRRKVYVWGLVIFTLASIV